MSDSIRRMSDTSLIMFALWRLLDKFFKGHEAKLIRDELERRVDKEVSGK